MDVKHWLECYLMLPGRHETREVKNAAEDVGISAAELRIAKTELKIMTTNNWSRGHPADKWFWSLPEDGQ